MAAACLKVGGYVRKVDPLGRVVVPAEWRRAFGVEPGGAVELIPGRDDSLTLRKYVPGGACTFCGQTGEVRYWAGKALCGTCTRGIAALAEALPTVPA